ncbi:MAG: hypothetical protein ACO3RV_01535 [Luteolibacter sp.]|jgi:hypothetical protein
MNRRRDHHRPSGFIIASILLGISIIACGGVAYVYYKNEQVKTNRQIDAVERRVEHARLEISTLVMRMDQVLNRFALRETLIQNQSDLRPIHPNVVEDLDAAPSNRNVASAVP